jgi:glutathione synthase/RimK-type ligase-like ATP-grasp enzyme
MAQKDALVVFSYHEYPYSEGKLFKDHVTLLNNVQGDDPAVRYHYGALCNMVFVFDGEKLRILVPGTGKDVTDFDFVFFQKWMRLSQHALAVAVSLEHAKTPFISQQVADQVAMSKLAELSMFVRSGIPTPKTVVAPMDDIRRMAKNGEMPFAYPFILKDIDASKGTNNFLINSYDDLIDKQDRLEASSFMAQEFIANNCDYRFAVVDGEVLYVLRRTRTEGTHLNNTSQGGDAEFVDLNEFSPEVMAVVMAAARAVGRIDFAGVDIILTEEGKAVVLEVNRTPEIQTGFNAERKTKLITDCFARKLGA